MTKNIKDRIKAYKALSSNDFSGLSDEEYIELSISGDKEFAMSKEAQDYKILSIGKGWVALRLAFNSDTNGWAKTKAAQDYKVLSLLKGEVAAELASKSFKNGWGKTKAAQDSAILELGDGRVEKFLEKHSKKSGWKSPK